MSASTIVAVFLAVVLVNNCQSKGQSKTVYLTSPTSKYTVQMTFMRSPHFFVEKCRIHDARSYFIRRNSRTKVIAVNDSDMDFAMKTCVDIKKPKTNVTGNNSWGVEYPGTKWCGPGNIARGYDDLGKQKKMDMCCRTHDHCPQSISVGDTMHGIGNYGLATISHCDCDKVFRDCLEKAGGPAIILAVFYFNVFKMQCFKKDYPILGCIKETGFFISTCEEYAFDKTKPKIYQLFDNPSF